MQPIVTHVQTCYHTCASHVDSIKYHINGRIFKLEILRLDNPKACVFYSYFKKPVFWTTDPQDAKCAGITSSTSKAPRNPSNIPRVITFTENFRDLPLSWGNSAPLLREGGGEWGSYTAIHLHTIQVAV